MLLKDKVALVTGSTHNIGLGIARGFAREGAKVIVHSRHEEDAKKISGEIRGDYFAADVAKPEEVTAMFDHTASNMNVWISWSTASLIQRRTVYLRCRWRSGAALSLSTSPDTCSASSTPLGS